MGKYFRVLERDEQERPSQRQRAKILPERDAEVFPKPLTLVSSPIRSEQPDQPVAKTSPAPKVETPDQPEPHLVSLLDPTAFEAEQYRMLSHTLEQMHQDTGFSVIAVSSPGVGDGKTTTAINLAGALAQTYESRVLLVDADLRRPAVSRFLGLSNTSSSGLVDAVQNPGLSLNDVIRECPTFHLTILPAGRCVDRHYDTLKSPRFGELLDEARRSYDYIVLDTPPLIPFPDCRLIERWADGFIAVVSAHTTPRKLVEEALKVVDPAKMVGLVFNSDDRPVFGYYAQYAAAYHSSPQKNGRGRFSQVMKKVGSLFRRGTFSQ